MLSSVSGSSIVNESNIIHGNASGWRMEGMQLGLEFLNFYAIGIRYNTFIQYTWDSDSIKVLMFNLHYHSRGIAYKLVSTFLKYSFNSAKWVRKSWCNTRMLSLFTLYVWWWCLILNLLSLCLSWFGNVFAKMCAHLYEHGYSSMMSAPVVNLCFFYVIGK